MVIRSFLTLAFALGLTTAPVFAQAPDLPKLAVFEAATTPAAKAKFGELSLDAGELTRQVEEGLRASRRFEVFERSKIVMEETIASEQELAADPNFDKSAVAFGKRAMVQYVVYPMVTFLNLSVRRSSMDEAPGRYRYAATGSVAVTTKVLDTTTGQLVYQATRETALPTPNDVGKGVTGANDNSIVIGDGWRVLARTTAGQITNAIVGSLFPVQVMQASGADIFVNRGEGAGINVGDMFQLFSVGEALIDPVTKEKLGEAETHLGDVQVVRVTPRFSVVRAVSPLAAPPKAGDVARPAPPR
jgi:hypothetical protein